jgi:hypothetical protein
MLLSIECNKIKVKSYNALLLLFSNNIKMLQYDLSGLLSVQTEIPPHSIRKQLTV